MTQHAAKWDEDTLQNPKNANELLQSMLDFSSYILLHYMYLPLAQYKISRQRYRK